MLALVVTFSIAAPPPKAPPVVPERAPPVTIHDSGVIVHAAPAVAAVPFQDRSGTRPIGARRVAELSTALPGTTGTELIRINAGTTVLRGGIRCTTYG